MPISRARGINLRSNHSVNKKKVLTINTIDFFYKKISLISDDDRDQPL